MLFLIQEGGPSPFPHFYLELTVLVDGYGGKNVYNSTSLSIAELTCQFPVTLRVLVFATCLPHSFLAVIETP